MNNILIIALASGVLVGLIAGFVLGSISRRALTGPWGTERETRTRPTLQTRSQPASVPQ